MASVHIPMFLDYKPCTAYNGELFIDGSFKDFFLGNNSEVLTTGSKVRYCLLMEFWCAYFQGSSSLLLYGWPLEWVVMLHNAATDWTSIQITHKNYSTSLLPATCTRRMSFGWIWRCIPILSQVERQVWCFCSDATCEIMELVLCISLLLVEAVLLKILSGKALSTSCRKHIWSKVFVGLFTTASFCLGINL